MAKILHPTIEISESLLQNDPGTYTLTVHDTISNLSASQDVILVAPTSHVELQYLTIPDDGVYNQVYFDFKYTMHFVSFKLTLPQYRTASNSTQHLAGVGDGEDFSFGIQNSKWNCGYYSKYPYGRGSVTANHLYTNVVFDMVHNDRAHVYVNGVEQSYSEVNGIGAGWVPNAKLYSCLNYNNPTTCGLVGDWYGYTLEENGTIISNAIPVRRNDGVVCFYDTVRSIYITPERGAFIAGPDK